jgi:hypothetical protein
MGRGEACTGFFLVGKPQGKDHWGDPGIDGRIIIRRSSGGGMWEYGLNRADSG